MRGSRAPHVGTAQGVAALDAAERLTVRVYDRLCSLMAAPRPMAFVAGRVEPAPWPADPLRAYEAHLDDAVTRLFRNAGGTKLAASTPATSLVFVEAAAVGLARGGCSCCAVLDS